MPYPSLPSPLAGGLLFLAPSVQISELTSTGMELNKQLNLNKAKHKRLSHNMSMYALLYRSSRTYRSLSDHCSRYCER